MEDEPLAVLEEIRSVCLVKIVPNGPEKFEYAIKMKQFGTHQYLAGLELYLCFSPSGTGAARCRVREAVIFSF
jgi:hypothetical protein